MGVCFVVEQLKCAPYDSAARGPDPYGPMSGQLINVMREACHVVFNLRPRRLMEALFSVELQCVAEVIGKLCGVVSRRRGRITADGELIEGTSYYTVKALLPVEASFGFATGALLYPLPLPHDSLTPRVALPRPLPPLTCIPPPPPPPLLADVRKKTGGVSQPLLVFSHWEVIPQDPFFVPTTEEEMEEFGSEDRSHNFVKDLIAQVRRRKGLLVEDKVVAAPEKQRTLAKKR